MAARRNQRIRGLFGLTPAFFGRLGFFYCSAYRKMINVSLNILVLVIFLFSRLYAYEADSTRQYTAKEVIVTASRFPQDYTRSPS